MPNCGAAPPPVPACSNISDGSLRTPPPRPPAPCCAPTPPTEPPSRVWHIPQPPSPQPRLGAPSPPPPIYPGRRETRPTGCEWRRRRRRRRWRLRWTLRWRLRWRLRCRWTLRDPSRDAGTSGPTGAGEGAGALPPAWRAARGGGAAAPARTPRTRAPPPRAQPPPRVEPPAPAPPPPQLSAPPPSRDVGRGGLADPATQLSTPCWPCPIFPLLDAAAHFESLLPRPL
mmetsp:Transcript_21219/g.40526  ORF Transcript_21219/g.40526 Transcript_21219/m.40526 type:complete len:228 (+) Transcript_21219:730-1413(+)